MDSSAIPSAACFMVPVAFMTVRSVVLDAIGVDGEKRVAC